MNNYHDLTHVLLVSVISKDPGRPCVTTVFIGYESLEERRLRSDLIMCYKILRGFVNLDRSMFFCVSRK